MSKQVVSQPYPGPYTVDASKLTGKLVDIPPGGTARLRSEQPGMDGVVQELSVAAPALGAAAAEPYATFTACTQNLADIRAARAVIDKLAEVLSESEAKYEHDRENSIGMILDVVRSTAKRTGDPAVLAAFDKTIAYAGQAATKAQHTRKKNEEAKQAAAAAKSGGASTTPGGSTPSGGAHG